MVPKPWPHFLLMVHWRVLSALGGARMGGGHQEAADDLWEPSGQRITWWGHRHFAPCDVKLNLPHSVEWSRM